MLFRENYIKNVLEYPHHSDLDYFVHEGLERKKFYPNLFDVIQGRHLHKQFKDDMQFQRNKKNVDRKSIRC